MSVRVKRLDSLFTKEISYIIMEEVKDPNIKFVTLTGCDITNDLSYAKVYFTTLKPEFKEETLKALNKAANFIEIELSKRIQIRKMPQISFHYDNSIEYGNMIEEKIKEIKEKENDMK